MDFQEGYCDGLAGRIFQEQSERSVKETWQYVRGYALGKLEHIQMTDAAFARWAEGLA